MNINNLAEEKSGGLAVSCDAPNKQFKGLDLGHSEAGFKIQVVTTLKEIERWQDFWMKNNRNPDADVDFYSLFVSIHADSMKPYILVATEDGHPKAMLIGRLENAVIPIKVGYRSLLKLRLRQMIFIQDGFLGESNPQIARMMTRHIQAELKSGVADRAYLSNTDVKLDIYDVARRVPAALLRDHTGKIAERWRTKLPASKDEFLKGRSKNQRHWLRRIGRVFEETHAGRVKYKTYDRQLEIENFCTAAEQVAQETYQRGLGVGFFNTPETHRRLELAVTKGWFRAYVAFVGDEPVAFWCGRVYNGVMHLDWTGYKPAYGKYRAGMVLFMKMLEDLCTRGVSEIDHGTGTANHKERIGDYKLVEGFVSIYAPTMKGLAANILTTMDFMVNKTAKMLARKLGVIDRIKKHWRGRLANGAGEATEADGERGEPAKE